MDCRPWRLENDYPDGSTRVKRQGAMDSESFRQALGRFASGVTIVTTVSATGEPVGFTATAFSSLSLDPPLVLFCLGHDSSSLEVFREAAGFSINLLATGQQALSQAFAQIGGEKFTGVASRTGRRGIPLLEGCLAVLECRTQEQLPGGDHTIFIGEVEAVHLGEGEPLVYYRGGYRAASP